MNTLSPELLAQLYGQNSNDPFLTLVTLSHEDWEDDVRLVNNTKAIVSRGETYLPFPMQVRFPVDDGESQREFTMDFDNVSLDLIEQIRSVTTSIDVKVELILASIPNVVQIEQQDLNIASITYNSRRVSAKVKLDSFLNSEITSERYEPTNFPGLF